MCTEARKKNRKGQKLRPWSPRERPGLSPVGAADLREGCCQDLGPGAQSVLTPRKPQFFSH